MFDAVILWLEGIAQSVPLPLFVILGGVIEEIIAPIPSPLVATLSGSIAASQNMGWGMVLWICAMATMAKTCGAWIFYILGIWFKDLAVPRFGKYIGVSQNDLERFGSHFDGSKKDLIILLIIRAIPVMPSTPISLLCGTLNIGFRTFLFSTLIGFYIRNFIFMMIGYTGLSAVDSLMSGIDTAETVLKIALIALVLGVLGWLYIKRQKSHPAGWIGKK